MNLRALFTLSRQNLGRSRRSVMVSIIGIALGIGSLSFFLALGRGVEERILLRVFPVGLLEVVPSASSLEGPLSILPVGGPRPLDEEALRLLAARPEVRSAHARMKVAFPARAWGGHELLGRDIHAELIAEGLDPAATKDDPLGPLPFSAPKAGAVCSTDNECPGGQYCPWDTHACEAPVPAVISPLVLELYNSTLAPSHGLPKIGKFLASRFRGFTFTIELGRSFLGTGTRGQPHQRRVMLVGISEAAAPLALTLPLEAVRAWNREYAGEGASRQFSSVRLSLKEGADVTALSAYVRSLGLAVADSGAEKAGLALTLITLLFVVVSGAILLLATLNIAHTFYRQVAERRREIGILRSVGASQIDVRNLLLGEAALIGLLGGLCGLLGARLFAWGADALARRLLPDFPFKPESFFSFDWTMLTAALICSVCACLFGAALPARRAAQLDPAEALVA
jgi:putative ABC transport system permease protein